MKAARLVGWKVVDLVGWKDVELVDRKVDWLVVLKVQKSADSKAVNLDVKMVG